MKIILPLFDSQIMHILHNTFQTDSKTKCNSFKSYLRLKKNKNYIIKQIQSLLSELTFPNSLIKYSLDLNSTPKCFIEITWDKSINIHEWNNNIKSDLTKANQLLLDKLNIFSYIG